jgi:hypothetical protein
MTRGELVAAALPSWDKTPFEDHQRCKGAGTDCKGLLWGIATELNFPEAQSEYATTTDYNLRKRDGVPWRRLKEGFAALFDQVSDMKPGDILLCLLGDGPGHIAIFDGARAWSSLPGSGVRSRTLRSLFHKFPLDSVWRWRD